MEDMLKEFLQKITQKSDNPPIKRRKYTITEDRKAAAIHKRQVKSAYRNASKAARNLIVASSFLDSNKADPYLVQLKGSPLYATFSKDLFELNQRLNPFHIDPDVVVPNASSSATYITQPSQVDVPNAPELTESMTEKRKAEDQDDGPSDDIHNHPSKHNVDHVPMPLGSGAREAVLNPSPDVNPPSVTVNKPAPSGSISAQARAEFYMKKLGLRS